MLSTFLSAIFNGFFRKLVFHACLPNRRCSSLICFIADASSDAGTTCSPAAQLSGCLPDTAYATGTADWRNAMLTGDQRHGHSWLKALLNNGDFSCTLRHLRFSWPKTSIIRTPTTSIKTSIKTITNLSDTNCWRFRGPVYIYPCRHFLLCYIFLQRTAKRPNTRIYFFIWKMS